MNKPDISIVLPTFNEQNNVHPIVSEIELVFRKKKLSFEIVFVDDSTDNTPILIESIKDEKPYVKLIHRSTDQRTGLGTAILDGIKASSADIVCSMDSDLQHPPATILMMYEAIKKQNKNFVVASRMMENGSAEGLSNLYRKYVSRLSSQLSWLVLPLTKKTTDPMTGFFMLEKSLVVNKSLKPIGFKLLVELLARVPEINSTDVPFVMRKRENDVSKATLQEGFRYLGHLSTLAYETRVLPVLEWSNGILTTVRIFLQRLVLVGVVLGSLVFIYSGIDSFPLGIIVTISLLLTVQGLYALFLMIYAWENPERALEDRSPDLYSAPNLSFTTLLPVRHETEVVVDTIRTITTMNYPTNLTEVKVICSDDDVETISVVRAAIKKFKVSDRVSLVIYDHRSGTSKPKAMNIALAEAVNDVVVIFDAEDEPHKDIFSIVNTVMLRDNADVVQSGVQLMDYQSSWFSMFNVMEYYFWFKSSLHFYARAGVIPLGGNTVFFKRTKLEQVNGWDENCLTEDGDVGLRLSAIGAKTRVIYDEQHVTQEETPPTEISFIKQRTRWNQGFLQILLKGEWLMLPTLRQRLLAVYVFTWPIANAFLFVYVPVAIYIATTIKMPVQYAMLVTMPLYILILHFVTFSYGMYQFTRDYKLPYPLWLPFKSLIFYFPYQIMLGFSALRAMFRLMRGNLTWEKTEHTNAHRISQDTQTVSPVSDAA